MLPLVAAALVLVTGCLPEFDLAGRDRCLSDADCLEGRRCALEGVAPGQEGLCVPATTDDEPDAGPDLEACRASDQDGDGAPSLPGCESLDCDDSDDRRSPRLPEFCDGVDNDCDELIDEGSLNTCGQCAPQLDEVCDGRDEDCDGQIDDGVTNACGTCGLPPDEFCDLEDNDCDGLVDEGLEVECGCDEGETRQCPPRAEDLCQSGLQRCQGGRWGACDGAVLPTPERCDGLDNDCDGDIDEDFDLGDDPSHCGACGRRCAAFQAAATCDQGACRLTCQTGWIDADGDPTNGCERACLGNGGVEACDDGIDNDCDGRVDEGCLRTALTGRYQWLNLFGRGEVGLPPGLFTAEAELGGQDGTFTDLTLYASDLTEGQFTYTATDTRPVQLGADGELVVERGGGPLGGLFRGWMTTDRRVGALVEFNTSDQQIASIALVIREPNPRAAPSPIQMRGLYDVISSRPGQLLERSQGPALVQGMSLEGSWEGIPGREVFRLTSGAEPPTLNPFQIQLDPTGRLEMFVTRNPPGLAYAGRVVDGGDFAVLTRTRAQGARFITEPALALMLGRRAEAGALLAEGTWTLVGLQAGRDDGADQISYNAVLLQLKVEAAQAGRARVLELGAEQPREVGSALITRASPEGERLTLDLTVSDNLQAPRLLLRGGVSANGEMAVFWELDDEAGGQPRPSIFIAIRHTNPNASR